MPDEYQITYPCEYHLKVMGLAAGSFKESVFAILEQQKILFNPTSIENRMSANGKYLALTITLIADNKEQLDTLYQALTLNPLVLMAL